MSVAPRRPLRGDLTGDSAGGLRLIGIMLPGLIGLTLFFWPVVHSGFALVPGDIGDARFSNFILEHWLQVLRGRDAWLSPPQFFPEQGTLGYSEAFLLFLPPYMVARVVGLTLYQSYVVMLATTLLLAYGGAVWLFYRVMRAPLPIAVVGSLLFAFSSMHAVHVGHPQLYAVASAPWLGGLGIRYVHALRKDGWGLRFGIPFALLLAGVLYTSFYVGWFITSFALVLCIVGAVAGLLGRKDSGGRSGLPLRRAATSMSLLLLTLCIGLIPLFITYMPVLMHVGSRSWPEVLDLLPKPSDFLNVTVTNVVWGSLSAPVLEIHSRWPSELTFGIPYLVVLVFLATSGLLIKKVAAGPAVDKDDPPGSSAVLCVAIAVVLCWVSMLRLGDLSLWSAVYHLVPGAKAIRAVFRFQIVLHLAVIAVVVHELSLGWAGSYKGMRLRPLILVLMLGLVVEQVNTGMTSFDGRAETARLDRLQPVPSYCRRFVLKGHEADRRNPFALNIDAALVAVKAGVPTLNGYSGLLPTGWGLGNPTSPGYPWAVAKWALEHNVLDGLCQLDLETGSWWRITQRMPTVKDVNLIRMKPLSVEDALGVALEGLYGEEEIGRWTNGSAAIRFVQPVGGSQLLIEGTQQWNPLKGPVRIAVNGETVFDGSVPPASFQLAFPLAAPVRDIAVDSSSFVPELFNAKNRDARQLGIVLSRVEIK